MSKKLLAALALAGLLAAATVPAGTVARWGATALEAAFHTLALGPYIAGADGCPACSDRAVLRPYTRVTGAFTLEAANGRHPPLEVTIPGIRHLWETMPVP